MDGHHHHHHLPGGAQGQAPAEGEKRSVAFYSVLAALLLTGTKVLVGLWTGSLGIMAEAMHSGLDLAAALVTLWAVRVSGRPADAEHAYGHGKIENLSALFETLLLLGTCAWIIWEAVQRLFFHVPVHVDANLWAFLVVILSIIIDYSRSRALMRVAKKFESQALEADALHFATDIWSSLVVLAGLLGVLAAHDLGILWLAQADAVAALGVAGVVVWVSLQLGRKSIDDLLDSVPPELSRRMEAAAKVAGVREVRHVRVRRSGPGLFVDLSLVLDPGESLERSHEVADQAEAAIKTQFPRADVVVHVEPAAISSDDLAATARRLAARHESSAHSIRVFEEDGRRTMELNLEMAGSLPLGEAHRRASALESELKATVPNLAAVVSHIEPAGETGTVASADPADVERISASLLRFPELVELGIQAHELSVRRTGNGLAVSFHCTLAAATSIKDAHAFTERIEQYLRTQIPNLGRVTVHTEPPGEH
jgi:cation diffusion facilitator family transporter